MLKYLIFAISFIFFVNSYAQKLNSDEHSGISNERALELYHQSIEKDQLLKQGKVYGYLYPHVNGSHYIMDKAKSGRLIYEGITYSELALYYDLYNDLVFLSREENNSQKYLILDQQKISEYSIGNMNFIYFSVSPDTSLEKGFYQLAFEQKNIRLLVKKRRELIKDVGSMQGEKSYKFVDADIHYLFKGKELFIIRRKKDLLEAFGNDTELKAFIKKNKLKLKHKQIGFTSELVMILRNNLKD